LEVGLVFAELTLLFPGEGRMVRELVMDGPQLGLFFASSSSSSRVCHSIDWILISILHMVCGRSARDPQTVHEKIFRVDSSRFNHGQSDFSGCGSVGSECLFRQSACGGRTSATPSRTVRRSHTDSPHRLLQFRACASVLVCLLPLLVPRLLGGSFEVV
jgi:hypothetical protein